MRGSRPRRLSFEGIDLLSAAPKVRRDLRGKRIAMILQDPKYSLNPVMSIGRQIVETLQHAMRTSASAEARERALDMLEAVQIRDPGARLSISTRTRSRAAWGSAR